MSGPLRRLIALVVVLTFSASVADSVWGASCDLDPATGEHTPGAAGHTGDGAGAHAHEPVAEGTHDPPAGRLPCPLAAGGTSACGSISLPAAGVSGPTPPQAFTQPFSAARAELHLLLVLRQFRPPIV